MILLLFLTVALAQAASVFGEMAHRFSAIEAITAVAIICVVVYLVGAKWIETRSPVESSLHNTLLALGGGLLGGMALIAVVMGVLWFTGSYHPDALDAFNKPSWLAAAMLFLVVAVEEEITFRGLLFRLCSKITGTWAALLISAAAFGGMHVIGSGAPLAHASVIALSAGVLLGAAYAATGRLWLPIGLHWGWDFTEDAVFGNPMA